MPDIVLLHVEARRCITQEQGDESNARKQTVIPEYDEVRLFLFFHIHDDGHS